MSPDESPAENGNTDWRLSLYQDEAVLWLAVAATEDVLSFLREPSKPKADAELSDALRLELEKFQLPPVPLDSIQDLITRARDLISDKLKEPGSPTPALLTDLTSKVERELENQVKRLKQEISKCISDDGEVALPTDTNRKRDWIQKWVFYGRLPFWLRHVHSAIDEIKEKKGRWRPFAKGRSGLTVDQLSNYVHLQKSLLEAAQKLLSRDSPFSWCQRNFKLLHLESLWCQHNFDKLHLKYVVLDRLPDDLRNPLNEPVTRTSKHETLELLIEACGWVRSTLAPHDAKNKASSKTLTPLKDLAAAVEELLDANCDVGSSAAPETSTACADYRHVFDPQARSVAIESPPLFATYRGTSQRAVVCKGKLRMPPLKEALSLLRNSLLTGSSDGSHSDRRLLHIVDWLPPPLKEAPDGYHWAKHRDCLLLIRLLCALQGYSPPSDVIFASIQNVRTFAMVRGFWPGMFSKGSDRGIPTVATEIRHGDFENWVGVKQWPGFGPLPVGRMFVAQQCNPSVLLAIEDVDWRLWLFWVYRNSAKIAIEAELCSSSIRLLDVAAYPQWEQEKRDLVAKDRMPDTVAHGIDYCVRARLKLSRLPRSGSLDLVGSLLKDLRHLEETLLRRLHELDPGSLGNLTPPRDLTGAIDVFRWRAGATGSDESAGTWVAVWKKSELPFGEMITEIVRDDSKFYVEFSASPAASDRDLTLLNLPFVTIREPHGQTGLFTPEGPFDRFARALLSEDTRSTKDLPIGAAVETLRGDLADRDRAYFDKLVHAATATPSDSAAVTWLEALRNDPRFRFECHPPVEKVGEGFVIRPVDVKDRLSWEDNDSPERTDLRVTYAIDAEHSKRVLSRGQPKDGSAEDLAARLVAACDDCLASLRTSAADIRKLVDYIRTFPRRRPQLTERFISKVWGALDEVTQVAQAAAIAATLDSLTGSLNQAWALLTRLADCYEHTITPAHWSPDTGTPATEFQVGTELHVSFHSTVPSGNVIVDQFHVSGTHARPGSYRRSAGPAPAGYDQLRELAAQLPDDHPRSQELQRVLDAYPRHVFEDVHRLAVQGIYELAWKAILEIPAGHGNLQDWKTALADLIRKPFDMVMFEPSSLGDYPVGWTVGRDGKSPFGRHIARVMRPGVRTLDKTLIWPAIVEME